MGKHVLINSFSDEVKQKVILHQIPAEGSIVDLEQNEVRGCQSAHV